MDAEETRLRRMQDERGELGDRHVPAQTDAPPNSSYL
jgi:hypothetical protein